MEVIGEDGNIYEIEGDDDDDGVAGDVMGDVIGYTDEGVAIVGARRRRRARRAGGGGAMIRVQKPGWRQSQLAPGVIAPDQGLLPLPMAGQPSNTFALATQNITFVGQLQKPFRGERLLVSTVRTGGTATGLLLGQLFVGTDLSQLDVTAFDIEQVGDPNAFGVRLAMKPAQPGVFIRLVVGLSTPIAAADTIQTSVTLLGRNIH
jgi:hypothetical protein